MIKIAFAAAALTAALGSTGAAAAPAPANEVVITLTARDLAGAAGRQRLMRRIDAAAEQLCGAYATSEKDQWDFIGDCRDAVFASAGRQLAARNGTGQVRLAAR